MDRPILEVTGLNKAFGGVVTSRGLSFHLKRNIVTGLVGPNGAGKSTLFNIISGFLLPDAGTVTFESQQLPLGRPHVISRLGIGRFFQDVRVLPSLSVLDNVSTAVRDQFGESVTSAVLRPLRVSRFRREVHARALDSLDFVGLADLRSRKAGDLSYGQQKRLALARLIALDCSLLLLDEPASGLDPSALDQMLELIRRLMTLDKTVFLIEHNLDVVTSLSQHLLFLDRGALVAEGEPGEVLAQPELADLYFGAVGEREERAVAKT